MNNIVKISLKSPDNCCKLNNIWAFGGNTCHMPLLLRKDLLNHLKMIREKLGFRYVRCHGTISDDMGVALKKGKYNFCKLNQCIDNLLEIGLRPFFEISAMPKIFARNNKHLTKYIFRSSPPKNWNAWHDLIYALAVNFKRRYGTEEVENWFFEVWNEPDIEFWTGTQKEYFKLYDLSYKAIKDVCLNFKVGGPATSKTAWIREFIEHISKPSREIKKIPRCDFISTHAYPSDLAFLNSDKGNVKLQNSNIMKTLFKKVRETVDSTLGKNFPVICGEWNSSAGPLAFNHDECNNAAFITKTMNELSELCQGALYWNISDIYEECGFHYQPFHGGYGMINVNDIPKSSFNAFMLLNKLKKNKLRFDINKEIIGFGIIPTYESGKYAILIYYHKEPGIEQIPKLRLKIEGINKDNYSFRLLSIIPGKGSPYEKWREIGSPDYPTLPILSELYKASQPLKINSIKTDNISIPIGTVSLLYN